MALSEGAKVEAEHSGTVDWIRRHPGASKQQIYEHIAKDHRRENPLYYKDLKTMEDFAEKTKLAAFVDELAKIALC